MSVKRYINPNPFASHVADERGRYVEILPYTWYEARRPVPLNSLFWIDGEEAHFSTFVKCFSLVELIEPAPVEPPFQKAEEVPPPTQNTLESPVEEDVPEAAEEGVVEPEPVDPEPEPDEAPADEPENLNRVVKVGKVARRRRR